MLGAGWQMEFGIAQGWRIHENISLPSSMYYTGARGKGTTSTKSVWCGFFGIKRS